MNKRLIGLLLGLSLLFVVIFPTSTQAALLVESQIQAILGLLVAFNVPTGTINTVSVILHGNAPTAPSSAAPVAPLSNPSSSLPPLSSSRSAGTITVTSSPGAMQASYDSDLNAIDALLQQTTAEQDPNSVNDAAL